MRRPIQDEPSRPAKRVNLLIPFRSHAYLEKVSGSRKQDYGGRSSYGTIVAEALDLHEEHYKPGHKLKNHKLIPSN